MCNTPHISIETTVPLVRVRDPAHFPRLRQVRACHEHQIRIYNQHDVLLLTWMPYLNNTCYDVLVCVGTEPYLRPVGKQRATPLAAAVLQNMSDSATSTLDELE